MMLSVFQLQLIGDAPLDIVRIDPTRMAQGIMTGIGFLGAGVIVKETLTVRGLTTSGSIWITASIGIMIGVGLYFAALLAEIITLGALSMFRWFEAKVPSLHYGRLEIRQPRDTVIAQTDLTGIIASHNISCASTSYHLEDKVFTYEIALRTRDEDNFRVLSETLTGMDNTDFKITPAGT
jgi:putative Mg2+ transporter-C (MgtC) family protein